MNTDQIEDTAMRAAGKAERALGNGFSNVAGEAQNVSDQVSRALRAGLDYVTASLESALDDGPAMLRKAGKSARKQLRRGEAEAKRQMGADGPLYLIAGAIGLVTLGIFALRRR